MADLIILIIFLSLAAWGTIDKPGVFATVTLVAILVYIANNPDILMFILKSTIWIIFGLVLAFAAWIYFDHLSFNKHGRFTKEEMLEYEEELEQENLERAKEIERSKSVVLTAASELNLLNRANNTPNVTPLFGIVLNKYGLSLKNDYIRIMSRDKYGRQTETQKEKWAWHLLEVMETCELSDNEEAIRYYFKQAFLHSVCARGFLLEDNKFDDDGVHFSDYKEKTKVKEPNKSNYSDSLIRLRDFYFDEYEKQVASIEDLTFDPNMSGIEYEYFCAEILGNANWKTNILPASGDHGADIIATKKGVSIAIQCKKKL